MKILLIDVETTGVDERVHGIIQISGAVRLYDDDFKIVTEEPFDWAVAPFPGDMVSVEALKVTGITMEQLRDPKRFKPAEAKALLSNLCRKYVDPYTKTDKFFLVGFNATFDDRMLRKFFEKCGDKYYGSVIASPLIDLAPMAALKFGKERLLMQNFKLATVAAAAGIAVDQTRLHDSAYDIELTGRLFDWCRSSLPSAEDAKKMQNYQARIEELVRKVKDAKDTEINRLRVKLSRLTGLQDWRSDRRAQQGKALSNKLESLIAAKDKEIAELNKACDELKTKCACVINPDGTPIEWCMAHGNLRTKLSHLTAALKDDKRAEKVISPLYYSERQKAMNDYRTEILKEVL